MAHYSPICEKIHGTIVNNPIICVCFPGKRCKHGFFPGCPLGNRCGNSKCLEYVPLVSLFSKSLTEQAKANWDSLRFQVL